MKLSEIKGKRTLDVVAGLFSPVMAIAQDKDAMAFFAPQDAPKGMTAEQAFAQRMGKAVPQLIATHRSDIIEILAVINGCTAEEYERDLTLPSLIQHVYEIITDDDLLAFFESAGKSSAEK